jgi:hypothetical protein
MVFGPTMPAVAAPVGGAAFTSAIPLTVEAEEQQEVEVLSEMPSVIHDTKRCGVAKCPVRGQPKYLCSKEGCKKYCHVTCHNGAILAKYPSLKALPQEEDSVGWTVACCKLHHEAVYAGLAPEDTREDMRNTWEKDGKGGKDDPHTSMYILLDWWTTVPNYEKYRGKNNFGTKKVQYAEQLARKMRLETKSIQRTAKQVQSKIQALEESFRKAHDWANTTTGQGLKESDLEHQVKEFQDAIKKMCPVYDQLHQVMVDRSGFVPVSLSYFDDDDASETQMPVEDVEADVEDELDTPVSDLADTEEDAIPGEDPWRTVATPGPTASVASTSAAVTRTSRQRRKGSVVTDLTTGFTVTAAKLLESKSKRFKEQHQQRMVEHEEQLRHNRFMEEQVKDRLEWDKAVEADKKKKEAIETARAEIETKRAEFEFQSVKLQEYHKMKQKEFSDEVIVALMPHLRDVIAIVNSRS